MKTLKLITIALGLLPMAAMAQKNIKKAFDTFVDDPAVKVTANHSLSKDPVTELKESQCDTYIFSFPKEKTQLLKNLEKAFRQDSEKAYQIASGTRSKQNSKPIGLAVGDGTSGVTLGSKFGMHYTYACFIAPEFMDHRYAYGMEWIEDGNDIRGTLVVTYATTQKYRQSKLTERFNNIRLNKDGGVQLGNSTIHYANSWFDWFTSYINTLSTTKELTVRRAIASKLYDHTKMKGVKVDDRDKDTAREILKEMLDDKEYSDPLLQQLLNGALINIK